MRGHTRPHAAAHRWRRVRRRRRTTHTVVSVPRATDHSRRVIRIRAADCNAQACSSVTSAERSARFTALSGVTMSSRCSVEYRSLAAASSASACAATDCATAAASSEALLAPAKTRRPADGDTPICTAAPAEDRGGAALFSRAQPNASWPCAVTNTLATHTPSRQVISTVGPFHED